MQQPHRPLQARQAPTRTSSSTTGAGGRASDRGAEAIRRPSARARRGDHHRAVVRRRAEAEPDRSRRPKPSRQFDAPEDIATDGKAIYIADGMAIRRARWHPARREVRRFDRPITALCCLAERRPRGRARRPRGAACSPTPSAENARVDFQPIRRCTRSTRCRRGQDRHAGRHRRLVDATRRDEWAYDLMERGRSGRVLALDLASGKAREIGRRPALCVRRLRQRRRCPGQRKLATSRDRDRRRRQPARGRWTICRSIRRGCRPRRAAASG